MTDSTTPDPNASYWHPDGSERTLVEYRSAVEGGAHLAHARYLGADAALAAAASLTMSESDAVDFLDGDGDHDLRERYLSDGEPNLSGEWADDPAPSSLLREVTGLDYADGDVPELTDAIADAWEEGRDAVWADAVTAFACRVTGDIPRALSIEASNEAYVDSLRSAAR